MKRGAARIVLTLATVMMTTAAAVDESHSSEPPTPRPNVIDPVLRAQLADADPQSMIDAVVVLAAQADLTTVPTGPRAVRLEGTERLLRATASAARRDLIAYLRTQMMSGWVADYRAFWIFDGIAISATPGVIAELATRGDVMQILPDLRFRAPASSATMSSDPPVETNVSLINAPAMWGLGYRGQGVVVASMDTGVDGTNPELASRWRGGTNSWYDPNGEHPSTPTDVDGHGTWTMGVMVGGAGGGSSIGVAPDATWIAVKIFNDRGVATATGIHQGFQWLLDPDGNPSTADAPNVVNDSWTMGLSGCNLQFQLDLRSLRAAGILPVFAAGNDGPLSGTSESPGNNPEAFAVGATDDNDVIDPSSSRGPSACGASAYPELVAPGVGIRTTDLYGSYTSASGTSMAAPHVAGALALLLDAFPGLSADRQEAALESGALDLGSVGADDAYGYGRLDVYAAYGWIAASPDFAISIAPASASTPPSGTVSYDVSVSSVNGFSGDVSLSISGLSGTQATWSLTPSVVSGGSGVSQLVIAPAADLAPGTYPLTIVGQSGSLARTSSATLVVTAPPTFDVGATPATQTVQPGGTASYTVSVSALDGFTGAVALSLVGLPPDVGTASFVPAVVNGAASSELTIATSPTAAAGSYVLAVDATDGTTADSASLTLVVAQAPDFALSVTPSSIAIKRGKSAKYVITLTVSGGFTGLVSIAVLGIPAGAKAKISPNPATAPGTSALTVRTTSSTPKGAFTLIVSGTSGALFHQASVTLTVGRPS